MATPLFIWVGSGRARKRHVSGVGRWLDAAAQGGLPVPAGAVLLDEFFRVSLDKGLAHESGGRATIPDAELWHNTLFYSVRLPRFVRQIVVRASCAEAGGLAPAGPPVNFDDPHQAARAVAATWSVWANGEAAARRDVLLLETVAAATSGLATTITGEESDEVILFGDGPAVQSLTIPQLHGRPTVAQPPFIRRLQQALRGARRTLGPGAWRMEWADDGRICWLVGIAALPPGESPA